MRFKSLRTLPVADVAVGAVLFVLAWAFSDADHGAKSVLGGIGWFGFLLCVLLLVVLAAVWLVGRLRRPAAA